MNARGACTSEGEANQLGDIEEEAEAARMAQSPPLRLLQMPQDSRLHAELLADARRSTMMCTVLTRMYIVLGIRIRTTAGGYNRPFYLPSEQR